MSDIATRQDFVETPVFLRVGEDTTFGIVTRPRGSKPRTGFIILPGGATPLTTNRNRMSVRVCRELASRRFLSMRCDYHGTGESTGSVEQFRLDQPFVRDVSAAIDHLREVGAERVIIAGSCFGGRTALATAAAREDVAAVMLLATSPRDYMMGERVGAKKAADWSVGRYLLEALRPRTLRGLLNPRLRRTYAMHARTKLRLMTGGLPGGKKRLEERPIGTEIVSPHFERQLRSLVRRGTPILLLFGTEDGFLDEFQAAAAGPLADVMEEAEGLVRVETMPGKLHGFTTVAVQDVALSQIVAWASDFGDPGDALGPADADGAT
ncbi:MAG TPA: alpha/beta fold hydrolase [Actinomycetota bacterium]|nr:alpha/beta fold hydrolase [Actinomycetota bacterium]